MAESVQHNLKRYIANILQATKNPQELFPKAFVVRRVGIAVGSTTEQWYYVISPGIAELLVELFEKPIEFLARLRAAGILQKPPSRGKLVSMG